jgi:hypothetical protein
MWPFILQVSQVDGGGGDIPPYQIHTGVNPPIPCMKRLILSLWLRLIHASILKNYVP